MDTDVITENIPLLVANADENDVFRSAVRAVGINIIPVRYKAAAYTGFNIQGLIDCWLSGHSVVAEKDKCIINAIFEIPNQVLDSNVLFNHSFPILRFRDFNINVLPFTVL